jgi:putative intracellular protease/amidase
MAESHPALREIETVRQLIDSVRAGEVQDPIVLSEAQERGFGALMSLEAQLQRTQRAHGEAAAALVVAPGGQGERQALTEAIHELAHVLTELRDLASPAGGPSRVGYGFVLPGSRVTRARRPTQA